MIRLGGPGPPQALIISYYCFALNEQNPNQVDPNEEAKKANEAVMGNVVIFALFVGLIRVSPRILESLGISTS